MTDRLYYTDPYLREFDARVVRVSQSGGRPRPGGGAAEAGRLVVTLDRTAFYPTSGGEPFGRRRRG
jgi:alanyl-tRNA synthetase